MTAIGRVAAEFRAGWYSFVRRRSAVFFTFLFPVILLVIFGGLARTGTGGGFVSESPAFYVPSYLAVVVLLTPLSRLSSTVARGREHRRFEKLATTPLRRHEWLLAHSLVNVVLVGGSGVIVLVLAILLTGADVALSPALVPLVGVGAILFCGIGAALGGIVDSEDGAVAASNALGLPLLFLSETFVPPAAMPDWFRPVVGLSPLTYFARGTRAALAGAPGWETDLLVLAVLAVVSLGVGAALLPWRS